MVQCSKFIPIRQFTATILIGMGMPREMLHNIATWLFCLTSELKSLPPWPRAVVRLMRQAHYRHYTSVLLDKTKFNPDNVNRDIARQLMARILTQQHTLQKFIISRKHTNKPKVLPNLNHKFGHIGTYGQHTGRIIIKKRIKLILQNQEVWRDFNSKRKEKN